MSTALLDLTDDSTAVFHDYFAIRGGGERLALELSTAQNATLIYGYRNSTSFEIDRYTKKAINLGVRSVPGIPGLTSFKLLNAFAKSKKYAEAFDVRIFSGVVAPFSAPSRETGGVNIFYCHTPPRFIYDQKDFFAKNSNYLKKFQVAVAGSSFKRRYERTIDEMDCIVANSRNVADRISRYLGKKSVVVYPPVDTEGYWWSEPEGYYLSSARLTPLKRISVIIDAFLKMPDKTLIVASGGEQEAELRIRAAGAQNIKFTGWLEDDALKSLISRCIATIYIPVDEDFGMSPVESMAAGKPVIGVAEGGLLETVLDGKTGVLLPYNPSPEQLMGAIGWLTPEVSMQMRDACIKQAQLFTRENFKTGIAKVIAEAKIQKLR